MTFAFFYVRIPYRTRCYGRFGIKCIFGKLSEDSNNSANCSETACRPSLPKLTFLKKCESSLIQLYRNLYFTTYCKMGKRTKVAPLATPRSRRIRCRRMPAASNPVRRKLVNFTLFRARRKYYRPYKSHNTSQSRKIDKTSRIKCLR